MAQARAMYGLTGFGSSSPVGKTKMTSVKLGVGIAHSGQPAVLEAHVVVDVDRPDVEAKPNVFGCLSAGYAIPVVRSPL